MKGEKRSRTKREIFFLVLVLSLGLLFAVWKFVYLPWQSHYQAMREEEKALESTIEQLEQKLGQKEEIETQWRQWIEAGRQLEKMVPSLEEIPQVLADLEALMDDEAVQINSLTVGAVQDLDREAVVTFQFGFDGEQENTVQMLFDLERFHRLLAVNSVAWHKKDQESWSMELFFDLLFKQ